jgi:hypothetical protein
MDEDANAQHIVGAQIAPSNCGLRFETLQGEGSERSELSGMLPASKHRRRMECSRYRL